MRERARLHETRASTTISETVEGAARERRRTVTMAAGVTVAVVLAVVFYLLRFVILPFAVAAALAYLAAPLIRWLVGAQRWPRWIAATLVYVGYLIVITGALAAGRYIIIPELMSVIASAPHILARLLETIFHGPRIEAFGQTLDAAVLSRVAIEEMIRVVQDPAKLAAGGLIGISTMVGFFLTVALLGYFIYQGPQLRDGLLWMVPPRQRRRARILAAEVEPVIYSYIRGVIIIVAYATGLTWIVTGLVLHLPSPVLIAIAVGLLEMVPVVGPALSLALVGVVVAERLTPGLLVGFAAYATGLRVSIDQLVAPLVLGRLVSLPPPVIIFAFLAGGTLFGMVGVLFAIPVAAAIKVILADLYGERRAARRRS